MTNDSESESPASRAAAGDYRGTDILRLVDSTLRNYNTAIVDEIIAATPPRARILDFGAGIGTLPKAMRARGFTVDCVEPDATQRAELEGASFRCYAHITDVPTATYDYIYSSNVLEHIVDDVAALRELQRALTPEGRLLLYVPAFAVIYTVNDELLGHVRRYTIPLLRARLQQAGFAVESARYADFLGFFVALLFKIISNKMDGFNPRTIGFYDSVIFPISRSIERVVRLPLGKNIYALARRVDPPATKNEDERKR